MNVRDALRGADPARHLADHGPGESGERLLREILDGPGSDPLPARPASVPPPKASRRTMIATALVAVAVLVVTVLAIHAVPTTSPAPARSPSADREVGDALESAVDAKLAFAAVGGRLDPDAPTQTWSDATSGAQGGLIDLTGKTFYLAAACTGGGTVALEIAGLPDTTIDCAASTAIGPIDVSAIASAEKKSLGYDVVVASGSPRMFAKAVALPRSSTEVASTVESNGRTLLVFPARNAGGNQALLRGVLGQNAQGCVTVGDQIIIAPSSVVLLPDGSLRFADATLRPGTTVSLGGGSGRSASLPAGSPCRSSEGDYFVVGDYPQEQRG